MMSMINLIQNLVFRIKLKRKGASKPIYAVIALTLAIMFIVLYYTSVSGWFEEWLGLFGDQVSEIDTGLDSGGSN